MINKPPCSILAPPSSYSFALPEFGNDYEITRIEDLSIVATDKLQAFMEQHNLVISLMINPKRFETHCDIHVILIFENDTDAVLFKLQWDE